MVSGRSVVSAEKNAAHLASRIMELLFRSSDWRGATFEYVAPVLQRMFLVGAADEMETHAAILPEVEGLAALRSCASGQWEKQRFNVEFLQRLGLNPPPFVTVELPLWLRARVERFLASRETQRMWENVAETTKSDIQKMLGRGLARGDGLSGILAKIRDKAAEYVRMRSERSARTGVNGAVNAGRQAVIERVQHATQGGLNGKEWLTVGDEKVRGSHIETDGQRRRIDEPFLTGSGNLAMFPGDPSLPLDDMANCRCSVVSVQISENVT